MIFYYFNFAIISIYDYISYHILNVINTSFFAIIGIDYNEYIITGYDDLTQ
jgi:hypothetical protein